MNYYLRLTHPDLLAGLRADPEAGSYVGLYDRANASKADLFAAVIKKLLSNPAEIYRFLTAHGEDIEWD